MDANYKDPFSFAYFLGLIAVILLPTLPATLTWIKMLSS